MEVLIKEDLQQRYPEILQRIKDGAIFIYPTDTIYGIGCDALNEKAVQKIRELKDRVENPFSVWAPSKKWIEDNCNIKKDDKHWLNKLPGPYTLILKLKNKEAICKSVNMNKNTLGVRIPDHWFNIVIKNLNIPIVTTSVNKAGNPFMTSLEELDHEMEQRIDFIIYENEKKGKPSKIVNLTTGTTKER
jgi:tRNA threonylcarbamoyl adenosine modification protein (Sua5/YciO/YrdC/YwlC family)